jgi:predicted PurR-regulated permease PerM
VSAAGIDIDSRWRRRLLISLTILVWIAIAVVTVWLLSHVVLAILLFVLAAIVSYAVTPVVSLFSRRMPRGIAIALAYVLVLLVVLALASFIAYTASTQVAVLVRALPGYVDKARRLEPEVLAFLKRFGLGADQLDAARATLLGQAHAAAAGVAAGSLGAVKEALGGILSGLLILILSVYFTVGAPRTRARLVEVGGRFRYGERVTAWVTMVNKVVGGYVRATLTMAGMVGVLVGGSMALLGVPYALLLGVIGFFMEFIPVVGVMISGAICILVALAAQGWQRALIVWIVFILIHVLEGDIVGPRIRGSAVGIHPVTALLAFVAGTELWGIWGALLGAPIAGLIQALIVASYQAFPAQDEAPHESTGAVGPD